MKIEKLKELSYIVITEYYNNNLKPFWEYLDENVIWYGPAEGHIIYFKKNMIKAWAKEQHQLKFSMDNIKLHAVSINSNACSIVMSFFVYTHYPNGIIHTHNQNVNMIWVEKKIKDNFGKIIKKPFIIQMFIANLHSKNEKDNIYAIHSHDEHTNQLSTNVSKRICVRTKTGSICYLFANSILWLEKANGGKNSIIYTENDMIECIESTSNILKQSDNYFVSPHISYLVNPLHIKSIERFKLTLDNGITLSIAEKKYTKFKNEIKKSINKYKN